MRIYWLNPPISLRTLVADIGWMSFSALNQEYEWIEPILDWTPFKTVDDVVEHIIESKADVLCTSSYVWNGKLCMDVAEQLKKVAPHITIISGGPHQPYFTQDSFQQFPFLDYACSPLATGEYFMKETLAQLNAHGKVIDGTKIHGMVMRGHTSLLGKQTYTYPEFSTYEYNIAYLTNVVGTAKALNKNAVGFLETTRGCPYSCTYCEWGGGVGTKVSQKPTEVIMKEVDILSTLGFSSIDIIDANFGILKRDPDIIQRIADNKKLTGFPQHILVYGVAKVKIEKREAFLDIAFANDLMDYYSLSVQSYSKEALANVKRTDIDVDENLALADKFAKKYGKFGKLEIIFGLPGSTLDDFYSEMDFVLKTHFWDWCRNPLSILPGTEMSEPLYRKLHKIKTVSIGATENDDNDITYISDCVLGKYKTPQEVVVETYSFTREEWKEMFFMNYAQRVVGPIITGQPSVEMKKFYTSIQGEAWFKYLDVELNKLIRGERADKDSLLYDDKTIDEWVTKFYINKEPFNGSYN